MIVSELEQRAAHALSHGDPIAALNALGENQGPHGRALRGIALAQMQEFESAQRELRAAAAALHDEPVHRARALAALAEIAAARRDVGAALDSLASVADELDAAGDQRNGAWARLVRVRILLLTGAVDEARTDLERVLATDIDDPTLAVGFALAQASASVRVLSPDDALAFLERALAELSCTEHPLLAAELDAHRAALAQPVATLRAAGTTTQLTLPQLATVFRGAKRLPIDNECCPKAQRWLIVDAIARRVVFSGDEATDLAARGVLFSLLEVLARAWPTHVSTRSLLKQVFEAPEPADSAGWSDLESSYRDRLRVEISRLRDLLPPGAEVEALGNAWQLRVPRNTCVVHVELPGQSSPLTALLADGSSWAARDLALAIGVSQRSVQRALNDLAETGAARPVGKARARRWVTGHGHQGIASQMLLVSLLDPRR